MAVRAGLEQVGIPISYGSLFFLLVSYFKSTYFTHLFVFLCDFIVIITVMIMIMRLRNPKMLYFSNSQMKS